jgi:hypothetical protein
MALGLEAEHFPNGQSALHLSNFGQLISPTAELKAESRHLAYGPQAVS